jgi:hypothetical protein
MPKHVLRFPGREGTKPDLCGKYTYIRYSIRCLGMRPCFHASNESVLIRSDDSFFGFVFNFKIRDCSCATRKKQKSSAGRKMKESEIRDGLIAMEVGL